MPTDFRSDLEIDPRFPSTTWDGFWQQPSNPTARTTTRMTLRFALGKITGDGEDPLGSFKIQGRYDAANGKVALLKYYATQTVLLEGWAEEKKGIYGTWKLDPNKGGFHIQPVR